MGYSVATSSQSTLRPSEKAGRAIMLSEQITDYPRKPKVSKTVGMPKKSGYERSGVYFDNLEIMKPVSPRQVRFKRSKSAESTNCQIGRPLLPPPTLANSWSVPAYPATTTASQLQTPTVLVTPTFPAVNIMPLASTMPAVPTLPVAPTVSVVHAISEEIHTSGHSFRTNIKVNPGAFNNQKKRKRTEEGLKKDHHYGHKEPVRDKGKVRDLSEDEQVFVAAAAQLAKLDS